MGSFFEILIPVKSWLHDRGWRQGLRLLIIPYALLPLIFLQIFSTSNSLSSPGWAYSLYVAPLWLLTFWYLIRPPQIGKLEVVIGIGIVIWTIIWLHVVTIYVNDNYANTHNILGSLVVGYNEEITKALPVLIAAILVLRIRKQKLDPRTWFLMGTVAGLTFGIVEQSIYTPAALIGIHGAHSISEADVGVLSFAFRVFVDGFQHAVWAGVSGFFIGMAINYRQAPDPAAAARHQHPGRPARAERLHADHLQHRVGRRPGPGRVAAAVPRLHAVGLDHRAQGPQEPELPRAVDHDGAVQPA